jgi:hypothetical protein
MKTASTLPSANTFPRPIRGWPREGYAVRKGARRLQTLPTLNLVVDPLNRPVDIAQANRLPSSCPARAQMEAIESPGPDKHLKPGLVCPLIVLPTLERGTSIVTSSDEPEN